MNEKFQNWLDALGHAWIDLNPKEASDLFSKDVEYYESALKAPCDNWDQVFDLWKVVPNNQKDITLKFEILSTTENLCVANWWMERMLLPGEIRQKIDGIFVFKLNDNGLCNYFKQWRTVENI